MEHVNDPDREEQEMIDKVKMDEVQTALQSQIVPDDEEEEISQEHIEDLKKKSSESGPMDRYVIRCMAQVIKLFLKKRLDVVSDFAKGVSNGFDEDDMPKGPTEKQMQALAKAKSQFS